MVAVLSNWLGRVWADRLMARERVKYDRELAELRSALKVTNQANLAEMQRDLDVHKSKHIGAHQDKLTVYRMVIDLVAVLLSSLDKHYGGTLAANEGGGPGH